MANITVSADVHSLLNSNGVVANSTTALLTLGGIAGSGVRYLRLNANNTFSTLSKDQLLTDLTPERLLYINDFPSTFFNGSNLQSVGTIPLTAAQAVVGTKIRLRGYIKIKFQGTFPPQGDDCTMALVFNNGSNSANRDEGVIFVLNTGATSIIHVDAELQLKAGAAGKYKMGVTTTQIFNAMQISGNTGVTSTSRYWDESGSTLFLIDPTIPENVGSTQSIAIQIQTGGGTVNKSLCNFWMDLNYEVIV